MTVPFPTLCVKASPKVKPARLSGHGRDRRTGGGVGGRHEGRVAFMRVVHAGQQVQSGGIMLDRMPADTAAANGAQIEMLQCVVIEIAIHKPEHTRSEIAVVTRTAADRVRGGVG